MGCLLSPDWCLSFPIRRPVWREHSGVRWGAKLKFWPDGLGREVGGRGKEDEAGKAPALDVRNHNHSNCESGCFQILANSTSDRTEAQSGSGSTWFSAYCGLLNADTFLFRSPGLIMTLRRKGLNVLQFNILELRTI